jgi:hypothetical protein
MHLGLGFGVQPAALHYLRASAVLTKVPPPEKIPTPRQPVSIARHMSKPARGFLTQPWLPEASNTEHIQRLKVIWVENDAGMSIASLPLEI